MDTYAKTRIDILVEAPFRKHLCDLVDRHGVSGYTVFPALAGRGDRTAWLRSGLISDVGKMELVVCIVDDSRCDALLEALRGSLTDHIGFVTKSRVEVIRPDRFA